MARSLPLTGVKVLELATYLAAPIAARILADWGATVIKVESLRGDTLRYYGKTAHVPCSDEENPIWDIANSGKRSIALNLHTDAGKDVLHRLVADADVFITNYRQAALQGLDLTWEEAHKSWPRLIWCHLSGYGAKGPEVARPGFDTAAFWARSGLMIDYGQPGDMPIMPFHGFGDMTAGSIFVGGICAALYQQGRSGKGTKVETSLLGTAAWLVSLPAVTAQKRYGNEYPASRYEQGTPLCMPYQCADGEWIELCIIEYERYIGPLLHILNLDEYAADPRFKTLKVVQQHMYEFMTLVQEAFMQKKRDEWCPLLAAADIVFDKVCHFRDVLDDEQKRANGYVYTQRLPDGGKVLMPHMPIRFDEGKELQLTGPLSGEHSREILCDYGYTDKEIEEMIANNIVKQS